MAVPPSLWELAVDTDARCNAFRRRVFAATGLHHRARVVPYRGFGTASRIRVIARVLEDRGVVGPSLRRGVVGGVVASIRRFATAELPGVLVSVRWRGQRWDARTDDGGFVSLDVTAPEGVLSGWQRLELSLPEERGEAARCSVDATVIGTESELLIVSDIDDTVIDTQVTKRVRRAEAMFLSDIRERRPFRRNDALYQALHRGSRPGVVNPVVYVSSSPWNLYEHLELFLATHGFPKGPLLLRDWGLHRRGFAPDGRHDHKLEKIVSVLSLVPDLPVILIGDSSQEDPVHYREIARRFPGRVLGILIRRVHSTQARIQRLRAVQSELRAEGVDLFVFDEAEEALSLSRSRGWVR